MTPNFYILCHERELMRPSSSANVISRTLYQHCRIIPWQRTRPHALFTDELTETTTALVYPSPTSELDLPEHISNFILLDGTWQETRKIYNQSHYLNRFPSFRLSPVHPSAYHMRKNQIAEGLCTAEVVMEILRYRGELAMQEKLSQEFIDFLQNPAR